MRGLRSDLRRSACSRSDVCSSLSAYSADMGITFIEVMPLGEIETSRIDQHLPLTKVRAQLARHFGLQETDYRTGGPARYVRVAETGGLIGFITPLTHNFCETCIEC